MHYTKDVIMKQFTRKHIKLSAQIKFLVNGCLLNTISLNADSLNADSLNADSLNADSLNADLLNILSPLDNVTER